MPDITHNHNRHSWMQRESVFWSISVAEPSSARMTLDGALLVICVCVCMYVYIYIYMHTCTSLSLYIYIYTYT